MAAIDQINQEIKEAMKAKDKFRLSVIRMLKGALQKAEIDKGETLTDCLLYTSPSPRDS